MEDIISKKTEKRMILNFSHDTIVGIMLSAIGVKVGLSPPYAATIFFELWEEEGVHYV